MISTNLKYEMPNVIDDALIEENLCLDDDITLKLQTQQLPLDIQLTLVPMWVLRSNYHDCMRPLDKALSTYMNFRTGLISTDEKIMTGTAKNIEIVVAFDKILDLMNIYDRNQLDLKRLLAKARHQLSFYSRATRNTLMWEEMMKLREIDYVTFTRRTFSFEHVVMSLFQLIKSVEDSLLTSQDISRCCSNYLIRITKHLNLSGSMYSQCQILGNATPFCDPVAAGLVTEQSKEGSQQQQQGEA